MGKKFKAVNYLTVVLLVIIMAFGSLGMLLTACSNGSGGNNETEKSEYTVTYNLNYEGAAARTVVVPAGTRTTALKPTRSGYTFAAWYTDANCTDGNEFDFMSYINSDITLYAKWNKNAAQFVATFHFNYDGGGTSTVAVTEDALIPQSAIPECPRLGMQYVGWYKDADCTEEWNFATDKVTGNLDLYASYERDSSVAVDAEGNVVYDNVTVNLWVSSDFGYLTALKTLVTSFNTQYSGKITVSLSTSELTTATQKTTALRWQQLENITATYSTYYGVKDVYNLAGIDFDESDYYSDAIREAYVEGNMISAPIAASVPFLIYNKTLMETYNGGKALPSNYTEFSALLSSAYTGERASNSSFKSITTAYDWRFKEGTSLTAFMQNDSEYWTYSNGGYSNGWGSSGSASYTKALTAFTNFYNLFGNAGSLHGSLNSMDDYWDSTTVSLVKNKNALMGIANFGPVASSSVKSDSDLGVMPISGLFADDGNEQKDQISVSSVGFQFYKASDVSLTQLAAAAEFVDYVSDNMIKFASAGWYPVRRSVVESDAFRNSSDATIKILLQIGDPENFRSLDGCMSGKTIYNALIAEGILVPDLQTDFTEEELVPEFEAIRSSIVANLP